MEVLSHKSDFDFDFNTARSPPYAYLTAPPSPTGFSSSFFSAPTSPNRISDFYQLKEDFAFDSPLVSQRPSLSADELFDGGKIRPLPPPQIDEHKTPLLSPKLARSPISKGKMMINNVFSSNKKKDQNRGRDRDRVKHDLSKNPSRRATRSLSPYRVLWEEEEEKEQEKTTQSPALAPKCSSRRWRLRDFLLFRSASEGRAADYKNPLGKHVDKSEEVKGDNLRSNEDGARRRRMSAHELHYTANRAAAEDSKKRTFLPYKQGILGG